MKPGVLLSLIWCEEWFSTVEVVVLFVVATYLLVGFVDQVLRRWRARKGETRSGRKSFAPAVLPAGQALLGILLTFVGVDVIRLKRTVTPWFDEQLVTLRVVDSESEVVTIPFAHVRVIDGMTKVVVTDDVGEVNILVEASRLPRRYGFAVEGTSNYAPSPRYEYEVSDTTRTIVLGVRRGPGP
jgi:hypothetical protein